MTLSFRSGIATVASDAELGRPNFAAGLRLRETPIPVNR
jgi:hypothetical protein